jgi:response regulator NasT
MKPARVILVDDTPSRFALLEQALLDQGLIVACRLESAQSLIKNVEDYQPDIIIMHLVSPDRETLENMTALSQHNPKPIILFSADADSCIISQAIQAGAASYIIDDFKGHKIKPILDAALAHFHKYQALRKELQQTREQLADRKIIDKAKGLLMKTKGLDEDQAYHSMRKMAMDQSKSLADIAKNILSVMELLAS